MRRLAAARAAEGIRPIAPAVGSGVSAEGPEEAAREEAVLVVAREAEASAVVVRAAEVRVRSSRRKSLRKATKMVTRKSRKRNSMGSLPIGLAGWTRRIRARS